jgi:hypothetical protein
LLRKHIECASKILADDIAAANAVRPGIVEQYAKYGVH